MLEIGPQHRLEYRQEVLIPFFKYVASTDSCYVIGAASMGKTRLLDHMMKQEVQKHYLKEDADKHWLIRVDMNRMPVNDPAWAFYELLVSSILLNLYNHENTENLVVELTKLDSEIIQKRDPLLALRFFELIVNKLCQVYELKLCFLLDEFDEAYKTLPRELFLQLRAVRDANKNRVSFALFLRNLPERLRTSMDNESFYELLSRNAIGMGPYERNDALQILQQLEARKQFQLNADQRETICQASGGHPGLMQAILSILMLRPAIFQKIYISDWAKYMIQEPEIAEECRKIWEGLSEEERQRLPAYLTSELKRNTLQVDQLLFLKGLLRKLGGDVLFFSGLFRQYVQDQASAVTPPPDPVATG